MSIIGQKDLPCKPGVYCIENKVNGKVYIGSSVNIRTRVNEHMSNLRNNSKRYCNRHFLNAVNKYGEESFWVYVLELTSDTETITAEQKWIDHFKASDRNFGYNIRPTASSCGFSSEETKKLLRAANLGKILSEETKEKIRCTLKGREFSLEHRSKLSLANKRRPPTSDETKKLQSQRRIGIKFTPEWIENLKKALKGRQFTDSHIQNLCKRRYSLVDPSGKVHENITNLRGFCKNHGLIAGNLIKVAQKQHSHHRGWRCYYSDKESYEEIDTSPWQRNKWVFTSPEGERFESESLLGFCKQNQLNSNIMWNIANGKRKGKYKGWWCDRVTYFT